MPYVLSKCTFHFKKMFCLCIRVHCSMKNTRTVQVLKYKNRLLLKSMHGAYLLFWAYFLASFFPVALLICHSFKQHQSKNQFGIFLKVDHGKGEKNWLRPSAYERQNSSTEESSQKKGTYNYFWWRDEIILTFIKLWYIFYNLFFKAKNTQNQTKIQPQGQAECYGCPSTWNFRRKLGRGNFAPTLYLKPNPKHRR